MAKTRHALLLTGLLCPLAARAGTLVNDEAGRWVTLLASPPRRIVCLAPSVTEILFAIGAGETLVGRDAFSDFPAEALAVPVVGSDLEPSQEKVLGLRPDVVFTATTANRTDTAEALTRLGIAVYVTKTESLADLERTITDVGAVVGRSAEAARLWRSLRAGLDALRRDARRTPSVKTLVVVWNEPLFVVGPGSYTSELLRLAGGVNVAADGASGYPRYALERVLRAGPQVILVGSHKDDVVPKDRISFWARYDEIPAVKDKRVESVDGDLLFRAGPRAVEGARMLFDVLHGRGERSRAAARP